jgi:chorismate-pyruvate lyase
MTGEPQPGAHDLAATLPSESGTVTEFLEHLAGEPIDADVVSQHTGPADHDDSLGLPPHRVLLRRAVVLTGRVTRRRFVYAESAIAADRLPLLIRRRLENSNDPIGRILLDHHLQIRREDLAGPVTPSDIDDDIAALLRASALSRRYRLVVGGSAAMVVSEWFLPAAAHALATQPGG